MKGQSFYKGSAILIFMVAVTKIMGLAYKLMLTNLLGGTGMAYYQSVYAVFTPVYAVMIGGIPSAVAIMTAESFALGRYKNARKIRRTALLFFTGLGLLCSAGMALLSKTLSGALLGSQSMAPGLIAVSPTVVLCCVISVYRGYFEGLCDMVPTAVSEIIETVFKLILGLLFAFEAYKWAGARLDTHYTLSLTAAASILGVSLSSFFACIYLLIRLKLKGDGISTRMLARDVCTDSRRHITGDLLHYAMPIALTTAISTLINMADLLTVPKLLRYLQGRGALGLAVLDGSGVAAKDAAEFIYGSFTALALTVTGMIPGFTAMLGKPALPEISRARAKNDRKALKKGLDDILFLSSVIAFPASFGLTVFSREVLIFLFPSRTYEVAVSVQPFAILSAGLVFGCFLPPVFALLQALGRPRVCVKAMLISCGVKVIGNITLMLIPGAGISGAAAALVLADITAFIIAAKELLTEAGITPDIGRGLISPAFAAVLCAAGARLCFDMLFKHIPQGNFKLFLILSICAGGIIYIFSLYLLNILPKSQKMQKKFKKIAKRT